MIQAPQLQYIPAQQPVQTCYPQTGAYSPVQYNQPQTPGVIYNYPTTSSYLPVQTYGTDRSQFNGVNIEIHNPQGQGIAPQNYMPAQSYIPAQMVPVQQPVIVPQYVQPYPVSQTIVQAPSQMPVQEPMNVIPQPMQQPVNVVSQPMPQPVQQPATQVPAPQIQPEVVNQQNAPVAPAVQPTVQQPAQQNDNSISPETFAGKLKNNDLDAQRSVIETIAETVRDNELAGPVLLDTQIFDALVDIIDKDTSSLEGPSPDVIALRQKPQDQLTAAEMEKAKTPAPLEKAEINKQYALYTISYMQERLNNELEKRTGQALELKDLPCIEKVIDTAKSNPNPMLRKSAIASLAHIARPQYKDDLLTIFELAKADEDEKVRESAAKATESLK